ncbi:hypothetical protein SODG_002365 [Sodalis praecaptivus]|uniref:fimbrial biogenesis chaperone n=1 Tax=Sodalis praecaptivus TaxID=1239307 RepID=UPI0027F5AB16|nr:fimbria/pilus periplasmic chaperone [Sodalis praecaptivus]CAJ0999210.1 hypothetical protein NVIRENTERO_03710 [Sodalis praecaptivus]
MTGAGRGRALGRLRVWLTVLGLQLGGMAQAGNAVLIWPVDPVINAAQKAGELWVENRGASTTLIQIRVFGWQQRNGSDSYQAQQRVIASPPMLRLEPGQKQMVRLLKHQPARAGDPLLSWRVVEEGGQTFLEVSNQGPVHARLSQAYLDRQRLSDGLFGYVLAHASYRWPLKGNVGRGQQLEFRLDNRDCLWRSGQQQAR